MDDRDQKRRLPKLAVVRDKYDVGYGKPPESTRFTKGCSGNPAGRPRGARNKRPALNEERLKGIILDEAYRTITILFGYVLSYLGARGKPVRDVIDASSNLVFGVINVIMRLAPIGAFGAMAFTIGRFGIGSLAPSAALIGTFYLTSIIFVVDVLGAIAWWSGFTILKFLRYIKEEIFIVLGTSSSRYCIAEPHGKV
ncbi:MAG: aerobic C4-dicarboxylate transport protein [Methylobacteriaceae bacterium]|jgi:hypothetical protein|nr:aerobic C4-dicarboxylate transport protein [Methylobacteriaceae bacterium]